MTELKFITECSNEIVFTYQNKKYLGKPVESDLADKCRDSGRYHVNEAIIQGDLPYHLEGVMIEYLFQEKEYHMKWICYFNALPSESDKETMWDIFGNILGDMPNISNRDILFKTDAKYLHQTLPKPIDNLLNWVFLRPK